AARLTEHHTAGGMSRQLSVLSELQPELFVEVSPELARLRGLTHLGWAHVVTARAAVEARVSVTDRMAPLRLDGHVVHQVWMPFHWGPTGLATCDVLPGRRPRGAELTALLTRLRNRAGITPATGTTLVTGGRSPTNRVR